METKIMEQQEKTFGKSVQDFDKNELEMLFNNAKTENGDDAYISTGNRLIDIMFKCEYYTKHPDELQLGTSDIEKLFAMFVRDPRYGLGYKNVGRQLMGLSNCTPEEVVKAGSFKDFRECGWFYEHPMFEAWQKFLRKEIENGNELAKKWCPRYSSSSLMLARKLAASWGMNKQQYGKFVKCESTVENKLSRHDSGEINFEHVPSKAMLKYYKRFSDGDDTKERFAKYLESVKKGEAKLNVAVTNVYDLLKACLKDGAFDADLFFDKIEKTSGNWLPVVDTSGSMFASWAEDAIYKALSIGHYLAKTSTYCPNQVLTFSSRPQLITLGNPVKHDTDEFYDNEYRGLTLSGNNTKYMKEIRSMYTGDCSNTNFGAVMELLSGLKKDFPEYLVVLSDMQFDCGSRNGKDALMKQWREKGIGTKIVWWNFNSRNSVSSPCQIDDWGNVFMSGYSPMLLKYLDSGFDGVAFLQRLLEEYAKNIQG